MRTQLYITEQDAEIQEWVSSFELCSLSPLKCSRLNNANEEEEEEFSSTVKHRRSNLKNDHVRVVVSGSGQKWRVESKHSLS